MHQELNSTFAYIEFTPLLEINILYFFGSILILSLIIVQVGVDG